MRTVDRDTGSPHVMSYALCCDCWWQGVALCVSEPTCPTCVYKGAWGVYGVLGKGVNSYHPRCRSMPQRVSRIRGDHGLLRYAKSRGCIC